MSAIGSEERLRIKLQLEIRRAGKVAGVTTGRNDLHRG